MARMLGSYPRPGAALLQSNLASVEHLVGERTTSADGGKTWELNWVTDQTKDKP
jgi:hypothetical protein